MIKAVLFDMDGILYDSEAWYMKGTVAQMRAYGYTGPQEKIYAVIGTTMAGTAEVAWFETGLLLLFTGEDDTGQSGCDGHPFLL
jgi:beta-phosphoglucomutase-like phosphatase (HAD superfamily)